MSFSDDGYEIVNEENYNDSEIDDNDNIENENSLLEKNDIDENNDDNENDYIDDDNDNDNNIYELDDNEIEDYDNDDEEVENEENYIEDNLHFNENDLENDSKFEFIVNSDEKKTSNILTTYELVELMNIRGTHISNGSYVFTDVRGLTNPIEMAKKEIMDNMCPLYIKRYIGLGRYELWSPNIMSKPKI